LKVSILVGTLALVLVAGLGTPAFAQVDPLLASGTPSPGNTPQTIIPGPNVDIFNPGPDDAGFCFVIDSVFPQQSFTPTKNNIDAIEVELVSLILASVHPVTINVYEGIGTGGPLLGSTSADDGNFILNTLSVVRFTFASPISITPGVLHTIEVTINDGQSELHWDATGDHVPNGQIVTCKESVANFPDFDYSFATYFSTIVVGGELLPIDSTALLLAGAQTFSWMIPVVLSVLGIGLFVVSRKSE